MSEVWKPRPFQPAMVNHFTNNVEAMTFASMGTGKTVCALTAISELLVSGYKGALIVAPIRVMAITFPDQIARWEHLKWMRLANLRTPEGIEAWKNGSAQIYMANPEMLPTQVSQVKCPKCDGEECEYCEGQKTVETHFKDRPMKLTHGGKSAPGRITRRRAGGLSTI